MATTRKKAAPKKSKSVQSKTGAGAAIAERSKDARKPTFGKADPKAVKPAAAKSAAKSGKPAKSAKAATSAPISESPANGTPAGRPQSIAMRLLGKIKDTATIAVGLAASVIGKDGKDARKGK
jgi:hypothetical protein